MNINIINIGCFKNLVNCEYLLKQLRYAGFVAELKPQGSLADIIILNTCGFIGDAQKESRSLILDYIEKKEKGLISKLIVMGCYSQRFREILRKEFPQVDYFFGNFDWHKILKQIGAEYCYDIKNERVLTTPAHYAYIKISEGCNQKCSYCVKPIINGRLESKPIKDIVEECKTLARNGVKELQLIAQCLTSYGLDIYKMKKLPELIERLSDISGIEWIRLHYAYPSDFPKDLLKVIRERENVCNYLDIAFQHCNTKMLKLMRRGMSKEAIENLISEIRSKTPGIYLRTTVMTGHPGETEDDFNELYEFIEKQEFERLGVFPYSHEEGSYCYKHYEDNIPTQVKRERALKLMDLQKEIYIRHNTRLIGKTIKVIIDSIEGDKCIGRPEQSTPQADPKIIIQSSPDLQVGEFYPIQILSVIGKDMEGKYIKV